MMRTYMMIREVVVGVLGGVSIAVLYKVTVCGSGWLVIV